MNPLPSSVPPARDKGPALAPPLRHVVQHAVAVGDAEHLRKLNELLALGWRVVSTASLGDAALVVIEAEGDPDAVDEFRSVFAAAVGSA